MNLNSKRQELIVLVQGFLDGSVVPEKLNKFVWDVIDYFSDTPRDDLPQPTDSEREFWYAVWQIQHLLGEEKELTQNELRTFVSYLKNECPLPDECIGQRPAGNRSNRFPNVGRIHDESHRSSDCRTDE